METPNWSLFSNYSKKSSGHSLNAINNEIATWQFMSDPRHDQKFDLSQQVRWVSPILNGFQEIQ